MAWLGLKWVIGDLKQRQRWCALFLFDVIKSGHIHQNMSLLSVTKKKIVAIKRTDARLLFTVRTSGIGYPGRWHSSCLSWTSSQQLLNIFTTALNKLIQTMKLVRMPTVANRLLAIPFWSVKASSSLRALYVVSVIARNWTSFIGYQATALHTSIGWSHDGLTRETC